MKSDARVVVSRVRLDSPAVSDRALVARAIEARWVGSPVTAFVDPYDSGTSQLWLLMESENADESVMHEFHEQFIDFGFEDSASVCTALASQISQDGTTFQLEDLPGWMMPVTYEAPTEDLDYLDRWYEQEHTRLLLRCSDWLRVRRYYVTASVGNSWNRIVLHDLSSPNVIEAPEIQASMRTPWRESLAEQPWFLAGGRTPLRRC